MKSTKNVEAGSAEVIFNELGMAEISDQSLLELIAGGMATMESQRMNLADEQCTNNGQCSTH